MPTSAVNYSLALRFPGLMRSEEEIFLPTRAAMLLEALVAARPCHNLVFADFHALPDVTLPGLNAPLVASTVSHCGALNVTLLWYCIVTPSRYTALVKRLVQVPGLP